eukprot:scaffold355342_cov17-Prasinocladus_malaysianus.AAC.1
MMSNNAVLGLTGQQSLRNSEIIVMLLPSEDALCQTCRMPQPNSFALLQSRILIDAYLCMKRTQRRDIVADLSAVSLCGYCLATIPGKLQFE